MPRTIRAILISAISALLMITSIGSNRVAAQEPPQATPVVEEAETPAPVNSSRNSAFAPAEPTLVLNVDSTTFTGLEESTPIMFTGTLTLAEGHSYVINEPHPPINIDGIEWHVSSIDGGPNVYTLHYSISPADTFLAYCNDDSQLVIEASVPLLYEGEEITVTADSVTVPCSFATDLPTLSVAIESEPFVNVQMGDTVPVTVTITIPEGHPYRLAKVDLFIQQAISTGGDFAWEMPLEIGRPDSFTIFYEIPVNELVVSECIASDRLLVSVSFLLFTPTDGLRASFGLRNDQTYPCSVLTPVIPDPVQVVHNAVCGPANDLFTTSQEGVVVSLGEWNEGTNTLTFAPADGYYFPEGAPESMPVTESTDLCLVEGHIPVFTHIEVCGWGNDRVDVDSYDMPEGVWIDTSESWVDGVFYVWVSALPGYELPEGTQTYYEFVDSGPCPVEGLNAPTLTAVCGVNNDEVNVPAAPEGVTITNPGEWSAEGTWTVSYVVEDTNYRLPDGMVAEYVFVDEGPCVVTPVLPAPLEAVCGPNNDALAIPAQPDGVVVSDTGWENNSRTISWQPAEHYIFPQNTPLGFTATDENIPCDTEPVGRLVTVLLQTSDSGSIEGTPYTLFAPIASQVTLEPFAEGVVGPGNRIVIQGLMEGDYRLVSSPEGYEPIDTLVSVTAGTDPQEITINVAAIQVPVTPAPTVEPTAIPTEEPTVEPTSVPTEEATAVPTGEATVAPTQSPTAASGTSGVTGLPQTGSGPGTGSMLLGLSGLLAAALVATLIGSRRFKS